MTTPDADVLVVGGGPAGAATATFLRHRGWSVLLVDAARFPRDKVCGEGLSPEAWRLLIALGAASAVRALDPWPLQGMRLVSPDGTPFEGRYVGAAQPGLAVRREAFDATVLANARAAGAQVREGLRATDVVLQDGVVLGVTVENGRGPETLLARLVVAADGRRSVVARRLGLLREHRSLRKFAVRGYWHGMEGLGDHGEMHVVRGGYCGIAPLGPDEANVTFVLDRRDMRAAGGDLDAFYRATLQRWPRIVERLRHAVLLSPPRAVGPLALEVLRLSAPGALLVGDAAGFYDPFTGEGVTLALESAELAADTIDTALRRGDTNLLAYDGRRRARTRDKFRLNRLLQHIIARPWVSNAVARKLARRPDLADRLVGIAGDFVPARSALNLTFVWELLRA